MSAATGNDKSHRRNGQKQGQDTGGSAHATQTPSIIVYRGNPIDALSTRHPAFFIEYSGGRNVLTHIPGAPGFFEHEEICKTAPPSGDEHFERSIPVAIFRTNNTESTILTVQNTIYEIPINNDGRGRNCQSWIGGGLEAFRNAGLISLDVAIVAADQLAEVLIEAPMKTNEEAMPLNLEVDK